MRAFVNRIVRKRLRIGSAAPDFIASSTKGTIKFHEYIGNSWAVFFSHPEDSSPVCTTEVIYSPRFTIYCLANLSSLRLLVFNPSLLDGTQNLSDWVLVLFFNTWHGSEKSMTSSIASWIFLLSRTKISESPIFTIWSIIVRVWSQTTEKISLLSDPCSWSILKRTFAQLFPTHSQLEEIPQKSFEFSMPWNWLPPMTLLRHVTGRWHLLFPPG